MDDQLALRRGFRIEPGERVLVVEDVITRGGRVDETLAIIRRHAGVPVGVAVLVDRSEGRADFGIPLFSLVRLSFPTWAPDEIPAELEALPVEKPGS